MRKYKQKAGGLMALVTKYPTKQDDDFFDIVTNIFKLIFPSSALVKKHLVTIVQIFVLPVIAFMVTVALIASAQPSAIDIELNVYTGEPSSAFLVVVGIFALLVIYMMTVVSVFQIRVLRSKPADSLSVLKASRSLFLPMIAVIALYFLVVTAGLAAFVIPGMVAMIVFSFAPLILVDKRRNPYKSLIDSFIIVKNHWKVVLALLVVQFLISAPGQLFDYGFGTFLMLLTFAVSIAYFFIQAIIYTRISTALKVTPKK